MIDEFYHKDIFGAVVDVNLGLIEEDEDKLPLDKKGREFNIFALTDALGARDRKRAWILYQEALGAGVSAEEVFFKVVWQIKSMLIASKTKNVGETDMKPFPYSKAKSFLKNFRTSELQNLSEALVTGYYKARRGEGEVETLVEKILLGL